ncbi:MAG: polysaccharide deacetylase family protein [Planctomycetes bacterium]|nr:polysaccharide deacetylase family protein [Planctomycetota bacterium]
MRSVFVPEVASFDRPSVAISRLVTTGGGTPTYDVSSDQHLEVLPDMMLLWESLTALVVGAGLSYFGIPYAYGRWKRRQLHRLAVKQNCVVLTLDDGPGGRLTAAVLQLLAARGVKATFFLLGCRVRENEDLVRRIRAQGHEIGSHTYDHLHPWKVAPWRSLSDIRRGFRAIDDALGTQAGRYVFRPPYGKLNLLTMLYLFARRIPIAFWTVDCRDTWGKRAAVKPNVAQWFRAARGGVVLAHDFDREGDAMHQYVLHTLRSTLSVAEECGLMLSTFSQLQCPLGESQREFGGRLHPGRKLEYS